MNNLTKKEGQVQMNVDLKNTTPFTTKDGNMLLGQGVILRKISRFLTGTPEDTLITIPVFYDIKTGEIVTELLPKELQELNSPNNGETKENTNNGEKGKIFQLPTQN